MSKKPKDIKHQIEKTLHTVADVAQHQYEKNFIQSVDVQKSHVAFFCIIFFVSFFCAAGQ